MNNPPQIEINLKNFRAIKEANIILDGITVVSGENGSGNDNFRGKFGFPASDSRCTVTKFSMLSGA